MDALLTSLPARVRALSPERQELVHRLLKERGLAGPDLPILPRPAGRDRVPASLAQERLWLQKRLEPDNAAYNIPLAVRLDGPLDTAALESALHRIAVRHEALRTSFEGIDGHLYQAVHPPSAFRLPVETVAGEEEARERSAGEIRRPFDLAGPLWRALLLRLDERAHVLVLTLDHIVADEWSVRLLIQEAAELYRAQVRGEAPELPELPVQYPDFSEWQRQWLTPDLIEAQLASWRRRLEPLPPLPWLGAGEPRSGGRGGTHAFRLGEDLTRDLNHLARAENATLFMLLMAAYQSLIAWHAGQEELTVGTDLAGRERPEVEPLIGFFVNQSVLRADLRGDPPFLAHLGRTREAVLGALACQSLPFQHLADALRPRRGEAGAPLFRTKLVLQERRAEPTGLDGLTLSPFEAGTGSYKFELLLNLREEGPELRGTFEASDELFDSPTLAFLAGQLESLLRWIVADPAIRQGELVRRLDEAGARRREEDLKSLQSRQAGRLRAARRRGLDGS